MSVWPLLIALAAPPIWDRKPVDEWTLAQVQSFMMESPWVQEISGAASGIGAVTIAPESLPLDHPLYDEVTADIVALGAHKHDAKRSASTYQVRWYSSHLMREVLVRGATLARPGTVTRLSESQRKRLLADDDLVYVLTISGPGLHVLDELEWSAFESNAWLVTDTKERFELLDVRTPRDLGGTAEAMFFFDRDGSAISEDAATVDFHAEIGTAVFEARFRLDEMTVDGHRDLAGDPPSLPDEVLRRRLARAICEGADTAYKRALTSTEVRPVSTGNERDFIVIYDPRREHHSPPISFEDRMIETARRLAPHAETLRTFWFVDLASGHQAYLYGPDVAAFTGLENPTEAQQHFKKVVKEPR